MLRTLCVLTFAVLIPSIDLQHGAVVQLVQGERLAIKDPHVFRWVKRFSNFRKVQVIDLDAAMGSGDNLELVTDIAAALPCRVGGGIRTIARARRVLDSGAQQIIAGSSLFKNGKPDVEFARQLEDQGRDRWAAAAEAARLRLRPILMTSLAFIFGVVPLVWAIGAGAELRRALGTAVFSGMIGVTAFGLIFTPVFYVICRRLADLARSRSVRAPAVLSPGE